MTDTNIKAQLSPNGAKRLMLPWCTPWKSLTSTFPLINWTKTGTCSVFTPQWENLFNCSYAQFISRTWAQKFLWTVREVILPLCSTFLKPHLQCCIQLWGSQHTKAIDLVEQVQKRPQKWLEGGTPSPVRKSRVGLFILGKRRAQGELIAAIQYLKGAYKKDRDKLFSRACCNRTISNHFKLREPI